MSATSRLRQVIRDAIHDAVLDVAHDVLEAAAADAPPSPPSHEDPDPTVSLRTSGYVDEVVPGVVEIGFRAPYAAKQHESLRLKHPRGGMPKFLERNLAAAELEQRIADRVRAATGSSSRRPSR